MSCRSDASIVKKCISSSGSEGRSVLNLALECLEELHAFGLIARTLGIADQLIDLRVAITRTVAERNVLADAVRQVITRHAHLRIGEARVPLDGQVVIAVAINPARVRRHVLIANFRVHADFLERLLDELGAAAKFIAIGQVVNNDLEARTVRGRLVTGCIEQIVGLLHVIRILWYVRFEEFRQRRDDRAHCRITKSGPGHANVGITVNRAVERLAYLLVFQIRTVDVGIEEELWREPFITFRLNAQAGPLAEALRIAGRHRALRRILHIAFFKRGGTCAAVRNDAINHLVQIRLALVPVVRIAFEQAVIAFHPLLEHERAGTDRLVVVRIVEDVRAFVQMLRKHLRTVAVERTQHGKRRFREVDDNGVVVGGIDLVCVGKQGLVTRMVFLPDVFERPLHVRGREEFAVVPFHAVTQIERERLAAFGHVPLFREAGLEMKVVVVFNEAIEHIGAEGPGRRRRAQRSGQYNGFGLRDDSERASAFRRLCMRWQALAQQGCDHHAARELASCGRS